MTRVARAPPDVDSSANTRAVHAAVRFIDRNPHEATWQTDSAPVSRSLHPM